MSTVKWKLLLCCVILVLGNQCQKVVGDEVTEDFTTMSIIDDEGEFSSSSDLEAAGLTTEPSQISLEPLDLNDLLGSWISIAKLDELTLKSGSKNWRIGPMENRNLYLLNTGRYSDCSFVVGEENDTQIFHVHKLLLQRASPVFETLFNITRGNQEQHFRISDVTPVIFKILLEYMYTGDLCISSYSNACDLLHLSLRFQLPDISLQCRSYLWTHLYPSNVWTGLQCASDVNDTSLVQTALQVAERRTEDVLKDPQFTKIPQSTLLTFLSQENLNINSEISLYEATLRWAKSEIQKQNLPETSNSYRTVLGPTLGKIRFLTLTPSEFLNLQLKSKILTCIESNSIISNLIAPGNMNISENLSTNNQTRKINSKNITKFYVLNTNINICKSNETKIITKNSIYKFNTASVFTSKIIIYPTVKRILGIQIPSQINSNRNISFYQEDLTVYILTHDKKIVNFVRYQATVNYNELITIAFREKVGILGCMRQPYYCHSIVIDFHTSGTYPSTFSPSNGSRYVNTYRRSFLLGFKPYTLTWFFNYNDFVYSIFTDYNSV